MKKQFTKMMIAAENLSRSTKQDRKDFELENVEKQVEKYRDVLEKMVRKLPVSGSTVIDNQERDKRIKKQSHYKIGIALEESSKELSKDIPLHHVLVNCGELEKSIAECIVDSELETETEVVRRLKLILDNEIQEISTLKRNVSRTVQEYTSLKRSYEAAIRLDESQSKINHIKDQQEQCEVKLDKERDAWAAQMFELIAKEDDIVQCVRDYILNQRNYHERALKKINSSLASIQDIIQSSVKTRFGTSLNEHLASTNREISQIIELCVCCLVENGLCEEGLLRVGCASTKLRRMKHALEAQYVKTPLPIDYQDPHVIACILKLYLRELPEPLLTHIYYKDFIKAVEQHTDVERKAEIKRILEKLPIENYKNLRYLTKFLWLITQYVGENKMSSQNLAIVMSPNMLWPPVDKNNPADYMGQVNCSSAVNVIVELLISQWDYFFDGEVDFFVTLQRGKIFMEDKNKSSSSNENLDRSENDVAESPRYGTIRRQKPCAPSPPTKLHNLLNPEINGQSSVMLDSNNKQNNTDIQQMQQQQQQQTNHQRGKELFPGNNNGSNSQNSSSSFIANNNNNNSNNNHNNNNNNNGQIEKPENLSLSKQLMITSTENVTNTAAIITTTTTTTNAASVASAAVINKPIPMTRTQFLCMDNLPSPVADRKSTDSVSSLTFKPDLPQKPKIPKRPITLGLTTNTSTNAVNSNKSDEENLELNSSGIAAMIGSFRGHKTAVQLVQEHCDNITALQANIGTSNTSSAPLILVRETNHNNQQQQQQANEVNANAQLINKPSQNITNPPVTLATTSQTFINNEKTPIATETTIRITPTTPVTPNIIIAPKRPTVPAPPPPVLVKKQAD
ncbi:rho GTPase activating protein at 92B isoform 1-T1 [Glossina fuscipes fuscipes]